MDKKPIDNPLDEFHRQRNIDGWNQDKLKKSKVLCLGAGGLGSVVFMHLLRLGVGEIYLVDYDKVDITNLNRQIMFTKEDVGSLKVDAAIKNAKIHNIGSTHIEGYNIDAVKQFDKIIELAKKSTFVFNMIDYGDEWDLAIQSLCLKLSLPHVVGGNFCMQYSVDFWNQCGKPCLNCASPGKKSVLEKITPDIILNVKDLSFLNKEVHPVSQSYAVLCTFTGIAEVNLFTNYLLKNTTASTRVISYLNDYETLVYKPDAKNDCLLCGCQQVPLSSHQTESTIIEQPINKVWEHIKNLKFDRIFPEFIKNVRITTGSIGEIGSQFEIEYQDKSKWTFQILEISEQSYTLTYDLIKTEPPTSLVSQLQTFKLFQVTDTDQTYLQWVTTFASDVSTAVIYDQSFKKLACFKQLKAFNFSK